MILKIVSWNVNSVRMRMPVLRSLIQQEQPDVILLQELKCPDSAFPAVDLPEYEHYIYGQPQYNGVAILVKHGIEVTKVEKVDIIKNEARCIKCNIGDLVIICVYVPCGGGSEEKYLYKQEFLDKFNEFLTQFDHDKILLAGDLNVARTDADVQNPSLCKDNVLCMPEVRERLERIITERKLIDIPYPEGKTPFTWWDYRSPYGFRIDYILTRGVKGAVKSLKQFRFMKLKTFVKDKLVQTNPSDHVPVIIDILP